MFDSSADPQGPINLNIDRLTSVCRPYHSQVPIHPASPVLFPIQLYAVNSSEPLQAGGPRVIAHKCFSALHKVPTSRTASRAPGTPSRVDTGFRDSNRGIRLAEHLAGAPRG